MTQKGMDFAKQNSYSRWVIDFSRRHPTDCFRVSENKFPPKLYIFLPVIDFPPQQLATLAPMYWYS